METVVRFDLARKGHYYEDIGISVAVVGEGELLHPWNWQYHPILCFHPSSLCGRRFLPRHDAIQTVRRWLEKAKEVLGFNHCSFDNPLLAAWTGGLTIQRNRDLCRKMKKAKNALNARNKDGSRVVRYFNLKSLLQHTLGLTKQEDGKTVYELLLSGQIRRVVSYCIGDVEGNVELASFAHFNGFLIDSYGLVPLQLSGGVPAWTFPGSYPHDDGAQPATPDQLQTIAELSCRHWQPASNLTRAEAFALYEALIAWRKKYRIEVLS